MQSHSTQFTRAAAVVLASVALSAAPGSVRAQATQNQSGAVVLSLADAVRLAERESESVRIARAGADRAQGQHFQARSQLFPDVNGSVSYQRALQLQFEEITKRVGSDSGSNGGGDGGDFADSPLARVFASPNTFVLGVTASQTLYSGGRVQAGIRAAEAGRRSADLATRAARAQVVYDIAAAYLDAQVAARLLTIAESSYVQTERTLQQTQLAREVGNTAEFDLIRARVQRDNTRPTVIAARTQRDVSMLRLRQMLNLPLDRPLSLTTSVDDVGRAPATDLRGVSDLLAATPDTSATGRVVVRQAEEGVTAQERQVDIARGQRWPSVSLSTNYQRFAYPAEGSLLEGNWNHYFPNWTVSLGVSMPLFTGGRLKGDRLVAQANLAEAQERHRQAREAASLDTRLVFAQLEQAEAAFAATAGTDEQATRAYTISEVRFAEGVGTQLELTQSRVDLETARANRVRAARDVALARLTVALLQDLPLGVAMGGGR